MPHNVDGTLDLSAVLDSSLTTVNDSTIPLNAGDAFQTVSHFYARQYLFPQAPREEDIQQASIGDCFLLAALLSIVQQAPAELMGMMVDMHTSALPWRRRASGYVVVRLYHDGNPVYFKLQKTKLTNTSAQLPLARHRALWVHMIEKAFALYTLRYRPTKSFKHSTFPGTRRTNLMPSADKPGESIAKTLREAVSGGKAHETFPVLLNWDTDFVTIDGALGKSNTTADLMAVFRASEDRPHDELEPAAVESWKRVFGENWTLHYDRLATDHRRERWMQLALMDGAKQVRQETITALLAQYPLSREIFWTTRAALASYIERNFPGKRGSARYSREQLQVFEAISEALVRGHAVQVSSREVMGIKHAAAGVGGSGEKMVGGLAGNHAYQVLRCERDATHREVRYIVVRNPWGHYARKYVPQGRNDPATGRPLLSAARMTTEEEAVLGPGVSRVELSDFTKRFDEYSVATRR